MIPSRQGQSKHGVVVTRCTSAEPAGDEGSVASCYSDYLDSSTGCSAAAMLLPWAADMHVSLSNTASIYPYHGILMHHNALHARACEGVASSLRHSSRHCPRKRRQVFKKRPSLDRRPALHKGFCQHAHVMDDSSCTYMTRTEPVYT